MFFLRFAAVQLLAAFAFAQGLGLLVGSLFLAQQISVVEDPSDPVNALRLFGGILLTTILLLLVIRFYKGQLLFKAMETLLIFFTVQLFLALILPERFNPVFFQKSILEFDAAAAVGFIAVVLRHFILTLRQPLLLFSVVIVGSLLGASLDFLPVLLLTVLLALYDFIAVFLTRHMITLARALDDRKATFTLGFKHKKEAVHLGSGDFVIPVVLGVSTLKAFGFVVAFLAAAGATAGLASLLLRMEKKRGYYPGLPPIVFGALAGVVVGIVSKAALG